MKKNQGEFSAQLGNYIANNKQTTHQNKTNKLVPSITYQTYKVK